MGAVEWYMPGVDVLGVTHPTERDYDFEQDQDDEGEICSQCKRPVHPDAKTCPSCQATRSSTNTLIWQSHREGRRRDIVIAGFCFMVLWTVAAGVLLVVIARASSTSSSSYTPTTSCSTTAIKYGYC